MSVLIEDKSIAVTGRLTEPGVEEILREDAFLWEGASCLDLRKVNHVALGAGWRLGNAISIWSQHGLRALVPDPGDFSGNWFRLFTKSGIGHALAAHGVRVETDAGDISREIERYYRGGRREMTGTNNVIVCDLDRRIELRDPDVFADVFGEWSPYVGLQQIAAAPKVNRISFLAMIREAIGNVYDHAYRSPFRGASRLSYVSLRRYKKLEAQPGSNLGRYLEATAGSGRAEESLGWIEIVVVDDGCGMAARQSQATDIYCGDPGREDEAMLAALESGGSIKPSTKDAITHGDPGYGFTYIADGLRRFDAYAELRTGRRGLFYDGSQGEQDGFIISEEASGLMPGTVLHVIFPLRTGQLQIPL